MADPIPIQLRHGTNLANTPTSADNTTAHLLIGEVGLHINGNGATAPTKLWVGDNTTNRLLLSTEDTDTPIMTSKYMKLTGTGAGNITGPVTTTQTTFTGTALVTKDWVEQAIQEGSPFQTTWDAAVNSPNLLTLSPPPVHGAWWLVDPGGVTTVALPGIAAGTTFNTGDNIMWDASVPPSGEFKRVQGGGMTIADADARYIQSGAAGGTMAGTLLLNGTQTAATAAATVGWADGKFLPLAGGTITGPLNLGTSAVPVTGMNVHGAVVVHGSAGTFNFVSENFTGLEADSTWSLWADGSGTASYAMLSVGNPAGPGNDQARLLVRSNGAVEIGSTIFQNAHLECFGTVKSSGQNASFTYESEDAVGQVASQWYMYAVGTAAANGATVFTPEGTAGGLAANAPRLTIRNDGVTVLAAGPRSGAAGASDAVRRQDVNDWVTGISGGTF